MSCNWLAVFTLLVLLCPSIGCNSSQSGSVGYSLTWTSGNVDAVPGIDKGSIHIETLKSAAPPLTFAVWTDVDSGSSKGSSGTGFYELTQQSSDGIRLEIRCDTTDGEAATMTIDGSNHDLSDGALFLISTANGKLRVLQIDYDMDEFPTEHGALKTLAKTNQEIREFFGGNNNKDEAAGEP